MKKTRIGGQALIEGLMMIGPKNAAIAVRKPDGEIAVDIRPMPEKGRLAKTPFIRGAILLFRQMVLGMKALMYSAEFVELKEEGAEPSKLDNFIEKIFGDKFKDVIIYLTVIISIGLSIGLFILLPNLLASLLSFNKNTVSGVVLYNLFEGIIRISLFFIYLILASRLGDIKRVWQYHGAEHKTIHCYEHEEELTVENVRKHSTKHPRCGTSFMFLVMVISILVFSFLGWHSIWINIISRLMLIPFIAGIAYEVLKFAGRSEWRVMKAVNAPGLLFQMLTTSEPDDSQIEVALAAFNSVRVDDENADKW